MVQKIKSLPHIMFFAITILASLIVACISELGIFNFLLPHESFFFSGSRFCAVWILVAAMVVLIRFRTYLFNHLEQAFLLIAIPIGFVFIIIFPKTTGVSQDDAIHLARAYSLLEQGEMTWPESFRIATYTPISVDGVSLAETSTTYSELNDQNELTSHYKPTFVELSMADTPSRLIYLPYYLSFKISAFLQLNFTSAVVFAKLCNLLCCVLLGFLAIKVSKSLKKIFFASGLLVANIFFASQFSYDPMITASLTLAIALFCRILEDHSVRPLYAFGFVLAVVWGSLPKATYCLLLLLGLLIPQAYFDHPRRARAFKIILCTVTLLVAATFVLPALLGTIPGDFRGGDTSVIGQISFILHNPLRAVAVFGKYITMTLPGCLLDHTVTTSYYQIANYTKFILPLINLATLAFLAFVILTSNKPPRDYPRRTRVAFLAMYGLIVLAILGALYLSFTKVGLMDISGVQPRYFLPILPLLLIFLTPTASSPLLKHQKSHELVLLLTPFLMLAAVAACYILRASLF